MLVTCTVTLVAFTALLPAGPRHPGGASHAQSPRFVTPFRYAVFEGHWSHVPDDISGNPTKSGVTDRYEAALEGLTDHFAIRFTGEVEIPRDGTYLFWTESDDGSVLRVAGELVVDNNGLHARQRREGRIELAAGRHPFVLTYFEAAGAQSLTAGVEGPVLAIRALDLPPEASSVLWYKQPASVWVEALPIGNGHIGAMVFGGVIYERLQVNDDSLWAGGAKDRVNPEGHAALPEVRRLLFAGMVREATQLAERTMLGVPPRIEPYQPLGDLVLEIPTEELPVTDYQRQLDLADGVACTRFRIGEITFTREAFSSAVDQVLVVRLACDVPGYLDVDIALERSREAITTVSGPGRLVLEGACNAGAGMHFRGELQVVPEGGQLSSDGTRVLVREADAVTLWLASATTLKVREIEAACARQLERAIEKGYAAVLRDHVAEHRSIFERLTLHLGTDPHPELPTGERLAAYRKSPSDPHLEALLFQYGRYLLMGSSRPGTLPANLQGLWNEEMEPAWNSDFHTNINLQMNYWLAEVTNLSEMHLPLFDLMQSLVAPGSDVARRLYGARGWVVHHLTDVWGFAAPADGIWGMWPRAAEPHPSEEFF
ncbi:MAG: glycoside hydrolase N-terminal domain-containing protein [Planctomycetota bacterium]